MFILDQCEKSSSVPYTKTRKKSLPGDLTAQRKCNAGAMNMMRPRNIAAILLIFSGIFQTGSALDFDPPSPITLDEGRTRFKPFTKAYGTCIDGFQISNAVPTPSPFAIDRVSGSIVATVDFDYEDASPNDFILTVRCTDAGSTAFKTLTVNIVNVNEQPSCDPQFQMKSDEIAVDEDAEVYRSIYQVSVMDPDGDDLTYRMVSQISRPEPGGLFFDVDPKRGFVYINSSKAPDFDAGYQQFWLEIRATDPGGLSCEGGLVIKIRDLNDELPVFKKIDNDTINVPENTLFGSIIYVFEATDRDAGTIITYSFPGPVTMFGISPVTGALTLREHLDYDNPDNFKAFSLAVSASDTKNTVTYPFLINITNVDEPPECDSDISTGTGITLSVPETFPVFTAFYNVLAKDPDEGDDVKFKISESSHEATTFFTLYEDTGIISTTDQPLDYESDPKTFWIAIKVENVKASPMSCTGLITIVVQNENDETPIFQDLPDGPIEIPENLPSGTVVIKLQATDRDVGDTVHYEFFTRYPGFSIDEDSGEIKIGYPLDYEDPSIVRVQRLIVHAFDNNRVHKAVAEIEVRLIDVNDNYPLCEGFPNVIQVPETTPVNTVLMRIKCVDKDIEKQNHLLRYKLSPLDDFSANKFNLTNNILSSGPESLDYDDAEFAAMQFRHILHIEVSDTGTPALTTTVTAIVRVMRENEFNPTNSKNVFQVAENSPVNSFVGIPTVTDADWPFNNVKFSFSAGDYGNPPKFYIEPNTGMIKVSGVLDYEEKQSYSITVQAIDLNNDMQPDPLKQRRNTADVTINILNVNDEPPVCSPSYYERIIYSTTTEPVLTLQCSDKDSPDEQLKYTIVSENKANRFTLQKDGKGPPSIVTTQNFQYNVFEGIQDPTVFQLLIEVTDEFGGNRALQLSTTATVIIYVVPWTTTIPTPTKHPSTGQVTTSVLVRTSYFWHPSGWFTAAITISAALLLLCLYALAWGLLKDIPKYTRFFPLCRGYQKLKSPEVPDKMPSKDSNNKKQDPVNNKTEKNENPNYLPGHQSDPAFSSEIFDGRAVDPVSGKHFLFNSYTGETKWI